MASEFQVSVRELKNRTTQILRRVEAGERFTITKRGHPVAVIEPSSEAPALVSDSVYQRLKRQIEARTPGLRGRSKAAIERDFERISRKVATNLPYRGWREMDRVAKGDRLGFSRQQSLHR
jgi:prevent-host-death family protein